MEQIISNLIEYWEIYAIGLLVIDKVVALSPSEWDDLIWTSVKKAIYKIVGKK
jgi:hypothetical protein